MTRIISCMLMTLFISQLAFGQKTSKNIEMTWGKEFKESKKTTLIDIVGYDESGIYALKARMSLFSAGQKYIEHYDKKMNQTKSVELVQYYNDDELYPEFIVQFNTELYLFSSFINKKQKMNYLFVSSINKKTLEPNHDLKKIAEINYKYYSKYNAGGYFYDLSDDSTKLMIYYDLPYKKGLNEKFGFHVFDEDLNLIWKKSITLPYKEELFAIEKYRVDNNGNTYILGRIYKDIKKEKRKGKPNYKYQVLAYSNEGNTLIEYPIHLTGKFFTDMNIAINKDNDIVCGGFFSEEGTFSIKGCYFLCIDGETKEITTKSFKDFSIDFLTQNMKERIAKKTKKKAAKGKTVELYEFDLSDFVLRSDGGALLIGEQYYTYTRTTYHTDANGHTTSTTTYYNVYNDIIVININPDGEIEWAEKIAKHQHTMNDYGFYSSYALAVVNDKLYFIFNDNPKNIYYKSVGKPQRFTKGKNSIVMVIEMDADGNQSRSALYRVNDDAVLTRPKVCEQIAKNEMIIFSQKRKHQRFGMVTFKD